MEDKIRISGIIFEHGKDDYGLWEGFNLTEDEENQIMEILMNHDTEGCSIRGTWRGWRWCNCFKLANESMVQWEVSYGR